MNMEERGLYITMLCLQWTQGGIKETDIPRLSSAMAQPSVSYVKDKFRRCEDGLLRNDRMESVRVSQQEFRKNRANAGKLGANARWHSYSTAMAQPMANDGSPSPSPSPIKKEEGADAPVTSINPPERKKAKTSKPATEYSAESREVLQFLNEKSGKSFRESATSLAPIDARLSEGGVDVFGVRKMISRQCGMWGGTMMQEYLRPETLFGKEKFDSYYASRDLPINLEDRKQAPSTKPSDDKHKLFMNIINSI